jgi:hypothetical protein
VSEPTSVALDDEGLVASALAELEAKSYALPGEMGPLCRVAAAKGVEAFSRLLAARDQSYAAQFLARERAEQRSAVLERQLRNAAYNRHQSDTQSDPDRAEMYGGVKDVPERAQ